MIEPLGQAGEGRMEKWRYRLITFPPNRDLEQVQEALDDAGGDGWDLVTLFHTTAGYNVFVFKRPERITRQ